MRMLSAIAALLTILSSSASAQPPQPPPPAPNAPETVTSDRREYTNDQKNAHYIGHVEIERSDGKIYADDVVVYGDDNQMIATGNVVFAQGNNRLSAERAEFDTKTALGTFYHAWGIASVQPPRQQARPGAAIPQAIGQETNVYFFGDKVERIGPKKYKITNGGFSTCVQPTPRWELHADTVTLNLDHYTLLRNAIFSVKGVPMLYTPFLYYPTKRDDRATGFLIPTYGQSSIRGHSIHDAFFWAIDRSQDATFFHDWYSKTGQGVGTEYRYNMGLGSDGNVRTYLLNQHEATYAQPDGSVQPVPAERSYEIRGGANQVLPGNLRLRARADYFSSITSMQTLNTNIYDLSRNQRTFGGNLIGAWGTYTLNGTFDHSEYFSPYAKGTSVVSGTWPRITFTRNERPLLGSPLYFSVGTDVAHVLSSQKSTGDTGVVTTDNDRGLSRIDVAPQIRYPFKKWQWFTVNSTTLWRETYYTRSLEATGDPNVAPSKPIDQGLSRPVFTVQSQILGPVFNRIWDTPSNGYAEKFKHTIEPFLNVQWTAPVENFERIITFDGIDSYVGGATYNYGLNNRFFAKRKTVPGAPAQAREFISVELTQSYYTDQRAAALDRQYASGMLTGTAQTHFSPLALSIRALPSNDVTATVRAEFDSKYKQLRTVSAQGSYSWTARLQTSATWTKKAFIEGLQGFDNRDFLDHYVSTNTTVHTKDNRVGGIYSFNYDVLHSQMTNQRMSGFYNAQCCGIAFEYQITNYGANSYFTALPQDRRFFMSFTLAGLGNFSPFNGALGGIPR